MGRTISNTGANTSNSTIGDDAINVTSAGGFSAGDYVYYNNGDYMTPGNSTFTTANFPLNLTMPVRTGVASGGDSWIVATNATNARTANATAKLSNGNIVIAYAGVVDSGGFRSYPCFKIIDENGNVIVSETQIEAAAVGTSFYTLACVALSGGGFAIGWVTSGNQFRYAIYSNAGAVVTAVATDTGVLINSNASQCMLSMAARPVSGGFVLALVSSTGQAAYKVYSSTGAQTYAWTTTGLFGSSTTITSTFVTCRSDDSLVITGYDNVANTIMYQVFSSTNTSVVASTVAASSIYTGSYTSGHCATLTNDSVVIVYSASGAL
jgi:hypothetical protein